MFCLEKSSNGSSEGFTTYLSSLIGCSMIGSITSCILNSSLIISSFLLVTSNCLLMGTFDGFFVFKDAKFSFDCCDGISFIQQRIFLRPLRTSVCVLTSIMLGPSIKKSQSFEHNMGNFH